MHSIPQPLTWRKSSYSAPTNENCVEVASLVRGRMAMRDSKNPDVAVLTFAAQEWDAFITGIKNDEIQ